MNKSRRKPIQKVLWKKYVWQRQTVAQLAHEYHRSTSWISRQLDQAPFATAVKIEPRPLAIVADTTFNGRSWGVCVLRSPKLKKNLAWQVVKKETVDAYHECRWRLEQKGFEITAAVIDGKPGVCAAFWDVPIQMCQFHQIAIITRYLTAKPKLEAGKELRDLTLTLPRTDEVAFKAGLDAWLQKWQSFMNEKSCNPETGRKFFTHKRLRSAYRSLARNKEILFTYQRYPGLNLPNTTNSLEGSFTLVKEMLRIHRGLKTRRKIKLITAILAK